MIFECVNFNEEEVGKMGREEFISRHVDLFWKNRDKATRQKMLGQAYDLMQKPAKQTRRKSSK